jgi:hypothetical protein
MYRISSNKRPGAFIFRSLFLKKLFNKNAINSHFSFFSPYKGLRGAFIRRNTVLENNTTSNRPTFTTYSRQPVHVVREYRA